MTLVEDTDNSLLANRAGGDHVSHQGQDYHDYVRRTKAEFPRGALVRMLFFREEGVAAVGLVDSTHVHKDMMSRVYVLWFTTGFVTSVAPAFLERINP